MDNTIPPELDLSLLHVDLAGLESVIVQLMNSADTEPSEIFIIEDITPKWVDTRKRNSISVPRNYPPNK